MNYQTIYDRLIDRARVRVLDGYCERHHVLPRCMGGEDNPANLVSLTAEEHYLAHQLLVKLHPDHLGILSAAHVMTTTRLQGRIATNKLYGWLRRRMSVAQTGQKRPPEVGQKIGDRLRGRKRDPASVALGAIKLKGKIRTPETRARMSASKKGVVFSKSHLANMAEAQRGKKASAETRAKMSAARIGRAVPPEIGAKISAAKRAAAAARRATAALEPTRVA